MKRLFNEIGITGMLVFKNLFSSEKSKMVILHYMSLMRANYPSLANIKLSNEQLFMRIIAEYPKMKVRKSLMVLGARCLFEDVGARQFREMIRIFGVRRLYSLRKELKSIGISYQENPFDYLLRKIETNA